MGAFSIWHLLIVFLIVVLLFGRGKISEMMGDVAKGIKSFKKGLSEEEGSAAQQPKPDDPKAIDHAGAKSPEQAKAESTKAS